MRRPLALTRIALISFALLAGGCGSTQSAAGGGSAANRHHRDALARLLAGVRPIGRGPRFQPGPGSTVLGACRTPLGARLQAHIEIFGGDRVVLLAAGIGTRAPRQISDGRLRHAACFGELVTVDPTGTVYFRPGTRATVGEIFRTWGQRLSATRIASFSGGRVRVYLNGRRRPGPPGALRLTPDAQIVLEVGPRVPPHSRFTFGAPPAPRLG